METETKIYTPNEIVAMWPQSEGELRAYQRHLKQKAPLTAAQLDMALQLAALGFDTILKQGPATPAGPSATDLDQLEALLDCMITRFHSQHSFDSLIGRMATLDGLWSVLKSAREKAGRPKPEFH
ncbi:MAG: hypothetical protein V4481_00570 [Patescibacteria group bacterium]